MRNLTWSIVSIVLAFHSIGVWAQSEQHKDFSYYADKGIFYSYKACNAQFVRIFLGNPANSHNINKLFPVDEAGKFYHARILDLTLRCSSSEGTLIALSRGAGPVLNDLYKAAFLGQTTVLARMIEYFDNAGVEVDVHKLAAKAVATNAFGPKKETLKYLIKNLGLQAPVCEQIKKLYYVKLGYINQKSQVDLSRYPDIQELLRKTSAYLRNIAGPITGEHFEELDRVHSGLMRARTVTQDDYLSGISNLMELVNVVDQDVAYCSKISMKKTDMRIPPPRM